MKIFIFKTRNTLLQTVYEQIEIAGKNKKQAEKILKKFCASNFEDADYYSLREEKAVIYEAKEQLKLFDEADCPFSVDRAGLINYF